MEWLYCIIDNILHCQFKNKNTRLTKYQKKIELSLGLDYRMVNAKKDSTVSFIDKKEHNENRCRIWHFPKFWPKKKNYFDVETSWAGNVRDVLQSKSSARTLIPPPHLHSFSIYFHCSYSEIHTDSRSLGWSKKSFRKSFYQARFSYVCITNQYNFEQIAVVFHFPFGDEEHQHLEL